VATVLEIIPLGGIGEFGMNCTLLRYGDEMLVLDAGMGFPEESVYGVDVCIPDFEILEQYKQEITAIILTHGHEDHLGALPYVLKRINVPVYASHFTLGLAESKLDEHGILGDVLLHRVEPRDVVTIGSSRSNSFALRIHSSIVFISRSKRRSAQSSTPAITKLTRLR
jgi:ribonuclease J